MTEYYHDFRYKSTVVVFQSVTTANMDNGRPMGHNAPRVTEVVLLFSRISPLYILMKNVTTYYGPNIQINMVINALQL